MTDRATAYATDVVAGRVVAGPFVRQACARHLKDLEEGPARGLQWSVERANHAIAFLECLTLADGEHAGQPFILQPWQAFVVGSLFGWLGQDGYRRFRAAYIEIGKGNGKTPLAAGLALYALVADGEPGAEVYAAAVSRDQAKIAFRDIRRFVEASPTLSQLLEVHDNNVAFHASGGYIRPVSSEGRGLDGKRVHVAIIDEVHEHPTPIVVDKMRAGTKGRRQALIVEITNSGYDRHSVCWAHHEYSGKVLSGVIENDAWFAYVCALDEGDDWLNDPSVWIKTNPNLGVSITEKYLQEQVAEARDMPSKRNIVARLLFCVWTEQSSVWLPIELWDACAHPVDLEELQGRDCYGGLDLASTGDIAACVLVFPPQNYGDRWHVVPRLYCPREGIRTRSRRDGVPYDQWADQGYLVATEGNVIDYAFIREAIHQDAERFRIKRIAFDRWNSTHLVQELQADGFEMVGFGQGYASMAAPVRELEKLIRGDELAHGGHPVLRWMCSNIAPAVDPAGNTKFDKGRSGDKIDGMVALAMALGIAIADEVQGPSVYETRGVLTL